MAEVDDHTDDRPERCESCGAGDEPLVRVRRLYVTPESWESTERVDEGGLEWWCSVCRTHYPHLERA